MEEENTGNLYFSTELIQYRQSLHNNASFTAFLLLFTSWWPGRNRGHLAVWLLRALEQLLEIASFSFFSHSLSWLCSESLQCSERGRDCLVELPLPFIITQTGSFHICNYIRESRSDKKIFQIDTMQNRCRVSAYLRITLMLNHQPWLEDCHDTCEMHWFTTFLFHIILWKVYLRKFKVFSL